MIAVAAGVKVLVATKPVDFRKGADGLVALVREVLRHDPFSETIFGRSGLIGLRFWRGRFGASSVLETAGAWRLQVATGE
jgi:hypothetical protein